jgi:hypothetical protein
VSEIEKTSLIYISLVRVNGKSNEFVVYGVVRGVFRGKIRFEMRFRICR